MTAAARRDTTPPPGCWCCGNDVGEADLVRLSAHPEVGVCLDCARWVRRRAAVRRNEQHPWALGRLRGAVHAVRAGVMERGWHERGPIGTFLRRIDRYLP